MSLWNTGSAGSVGSIQSAEQHLIDQGLLRRARGDETTSQPTEKGLAAGLRPDARGYRKPGADTPPTAAAAAPDADAVDSDAADLNGPARRQGPAAGRLVEVMPRLDADQAETVLARAREAGLDGESPVVSAALERLEQVGGKRRANAARKWFGAEGDAAERRATRADAGTRREQQQAYAEYVQDIAAQLEEVNRGGNAVRRRAGDGANRRSSVTGPDRPELGAVLTSNAATIKARLSPESLERLAEIGGPPLPFDAWRYERLGARDARAVESYQRRTTGYFSEYG